MPFSLIAWFVLQIHACEERKKTGNFPWLAGEENKGLRWSTKDTERICGDKWQNSKCRSEPLGTLGWP